MILTNSVSDQNVYFTYVCLINDINPSRNVNGIEHSKTMYGIPGQEDDGIDDEEEPIQVERSRAVHELVESNSKAKRPRLKDDLNNEINSAFTEAATTSGGGSELTEKDEYSTLCFDNPNILKLTKMKWLSEDKEGSLDSRSPTLSPASSTSSGFSKNSQENLNESLSVSDRCLDTILRLDKEHNMFGLSNITIVGSKTSRKSRKEDERPVFHQTAIIQVCCGKGCCKRMSNTDLPTSLKCGGCRTCCTACSTCIGICRPPCITSPSPSVCFTCPTGKYKCRTPCVPSKCALDYSSCFGLKLSLNRKPVYEPSPIELTPRSSCILQKPLAARTCHHQPHCVPPSSCFPYLMPCYWPARSGAPCNHPAKCFHNPPCPPPRKRIPILAPEDYATKCPKNKKCEDEAKKTKCPNISCPGKNAAFKQEIESRFGKKEIQQST